MYKKKYKISLTFYYKCFTHKVTQPFHPLIIPHHDGGGGDVTALYNIITRLNFKLFYSMETFNLIILFYLNFGNHLLLIIVYIKIHRLGAMTIEIWSIFLMFNSKPFLNKCDILHLSPDLYSSILDIRQS